MEIENREIREVVVRLKILRFIIMDSGYPKY